MVVCRLRKNSDFCLNENRDSLSRRQLSTVHNSRCGASEVVTDQGDKTDEYYQKKCSSSNDSFSIEQIDSASESNLKLTTDVTQTGSSCPQKVILFLSEVFGIYGCHSLMSSTVQY